MSIGSIHATSGALPENAAMDATQPRPDQPRRGTISPAQPTPAQKIAYLQGYEEATQSGEGRS